MMALKMKLTDNDNGKDHVQFMMIIMIKIINMAEIMVKLFSNIDNLYNYNYYHILLNI